MQIILNYIYNIILLIFKCFKYKKVYFSWENPYVIFVKIFKPWIEISMCVHHVEDYWGNSFIWKLLLKSSSKIIAISKFTKLQLLNLWVDKSKIVVNYNWISSKYFSEKVKNFKWYEYVLYVWSELTRKNFITLLNAYKLVFKKYPNIKLIKIWPAYNNKEQTDLEIENLWLVDNVILKRDFLIKMN